MSFRDDGNSFTKSNKPLKSSQILSDIDTNTNAPREISTLLNTLLKKDKQIEYYKHEIVSRDDKLREFEYLIVKASEEIKKKQGEIINLTAALDNNRASQNANEIAKVPLLQKELANANNELKSVEIQSTTNLIQLKMELQREKEVNSTLQKVIQDSKGHSQSTLQELRISLDSLQKTHAASLHKLHRIETDNNNISKLLEEAKQESSSKDQTIDNAHQIIKKLKLEIEAFNEKGGDLQGKVKKYKNKCRSYKNNNNILNEQLKSLEEKLKIQEIIVQEFNRSKGDLQNLMRNKIEEKNHFSEEKEHLLNEIVRLENLVKPLKDENFVSISEIEKQKACILLEAEKNKEICSQLVDKEEIITRLQIQIQELEKKHKNEFDLFKYQTAKTFEIFNTKEHISNNPGNNFVRQASPKGFSNVIYSNKEINNEHFSSNKSVTKPFASTESNINILRPKSMIKTTPIKMFTPTMINNQVMITETQSLAGSAKKFSLVNDSFSAENYNKQNEICLIPVPDLQKQSQEKSFKEIMTMEMLTEELERALGTEYHLCLLIEGVNLQVL